MELYIIDECGMKLDEIGKTNGKEKGIPRKGHGWPLRALIRRERLCVLQNNCCIYCVGCEFFV